MKCQRVVKLSAPALLAAVAIWKFWNSENLKILLEACNPMHKIWKSEIPRWTCSNSEIEAKSAHCRGDMPLLFGWVLVSLVN